MGILDGTKEQKSVSKSKGSSFFGGALEKEVGKRVGPIVQKMDQLIPELQKQTAGAKSLTNEIKNLTSEIKKLNTKLDKK